jgi:disease resistance protein RPM1
MAEAVVGQVVVKLGAVLAKDALTFAAKLLWKEASALRGLFGKIRDSKAELESMQAYLQEAERFKDTDRTTAIFVREIRGLAFQIEDVIDEFTYKLEEDRHGGFAAKMKKRLKHIKTWRRLADKLQEIETKLQDANRRRTVYSIGTFASVAISTSRGQALHFTRDEDLMGIEENKDRLIWWLTVGGASGGDFDQMSSKVSTVWGMPGVGKTTLVAHVYNTVKVDFDAAVWITVSESYRIEDLLRKIVTELGIHVANVEMRGLAESIHSYLQGKKYILVLDDVWNARLWSELRNVFPTSNSTGRFVLTSRKHEVSLLATRESVIHVEPLQPHHSWVLFCKGAFWNDGDKDAHWSCRN